MHLHLSRTKYVFGLGTIAAFLAVASVAYACIPFKGSLKITTPAGRVTGTTVIGDGTATNHSYCSTGVPTVAGTAQGGDSITVDVAPAACAGTTYQLPDATDYSVILNNTAGASAPFTYDGTRWNFVAGTGCFASPTPSGNITYKNGNFTVASGIGTATFTLTSPLNTANTTGTPVNGSDASGLCVGKSGGSGIFAPLRILAI